MAPNMACHGFKKKVYSAVGWNVFKMLIIFCLMVLFNEIIDLNPAIQ